MTNWEKCDKCIHEKVCNQTEYYLEHSDEECVEYADEKTENYEEGYMNGFSNGVEQTFNELRYICKEHVMSELRKRMKEVHGV